ncbi:MAG: LuxR C-terminal-related transcriptional regulator [Nitrospiraceae bacterium]
MKVLIVSINYMIRAGIRLILETRPDIFIAGEVGAPGTTVEAAVRENPDVILLDLDLSGMDVLKLIEDLGQAAKDSLTLVLSSLGDEALAQKALCCGAGGVVLKVQPPAVLIAAIESLCREGRREVERLRVRPDVISFNTLRPVGKGGREIAKINSLTSRERDIIKLIGKGFKNKEIAHQLSLSEITVRHHLTNIFSKLQVSDRQKLLILAHHYQLTELTPCTETT